MPFAARAVPLVERFRHAGIDYFVNRLTLYDRERIPCGRVIWRSTLDVPFEDPAGVRSRGPIAVVDVRDC